MKKSEVLMKLRQCGAVAVIRGDSYDEGLNISKACIQGGLEAIEMAYTNSHASQIIQDLKEMYKDDLDVIVGAGTVLDAPTARSAILAGAQYLLCHHHLIMIQRFYVIVMVFLIFRVV